MKQICFFFVTALFISSCSSDNESPKPKKELSDAEILEKRYKSADNILIYEGEKIFLLSVIKNVNYDTLYTIIRDYHALYTVSYTYDKKSRELLMNTIERISEKFGFPKSKIASFIFNYKYEMVTRDDIIEESHYDEYQEGDNYDPY